MGASDPLPPDPLPPWESYAEELAVILDEVGSERAAIMAAHDAGPTALFFAGARPERTSALILVNTSARYVAADDYPIGIPLEVAEALLAQIDQLWGTEALVAMMVPSRTGDERFRRWFARWRCSTSSSATDGWSTTPAGTETPSRPSKLPGTTTSKRDHWPITYGRRFAGKLRQPGYHRGWAVPFSGTARPGRQR
jgi:pimeloyl-ACP methyl ester carboxylesterase